jgi:hypothetical protein
LGHPVHADGGAGSGADNAGIANGSFPLTPIRAYSDAVPTLEGSANVPTISAWGATEDDEGGASGGSDGTTNDPPATFGAAYRPIYHPHGGEGGAE